MKSPSSLRTIIVVVIILIAGAVAVFLALPRPAAQPPAPSAALALPSASPTVTVAVTAISASATPPPGTPVPGALVRVWNNMCVEGVPYTLLSVPLDASFALVQAQAQLAPTLIPITGITPTPSSIAPYSTPGFVGGTAAPLPTDTATLQAVNGTAIAPSSNKGTLGLVPKQNSCKGLGEMNGVQLFMCTGPQGNPLNIYARDASGTQLYQGTLWDCAVGPSPTLRPTPTQASIAQPTLPGATVPPTVPPTTAPPTLPPTGLPPTLPATAPPPATATP